MRIRILQDANGALVGAAAAPDAAPAAPAPTPPLARAIQGAICSLQELPVLKERNRDAAAKPGLFQCSVLIVRASSKVSALSLFYC